MAVCEFHNKYAEYLAQLDREPLADGSLKFWGWDAVLDVLKAIRTSEYLEQITSEEAGNLTSELYKLYPQFEERIRTELTQQVR